MASEDVVVCIGTDRIRTNPNQPRKVFSEQALKELSLSIREHGVIQPLVVEQVSDDIYSIVAGERRFRASVMAGLKEVPCIIRSFSETQRMEIALIENIQREELNPVEEARAYRQLMAQTDLSQDELASKVGKSRSAVANSVRLLNLPDEVLNTIEAGTLSPGHGRALLSVVNPSERQLLFNAILSKHLSVRQAEDLALRYNKGARAVNRKRKGVGQDNGNREAGVVDVEEKFTSICGSEAKIKGKLSKGSIVIPYSDDSELENIYRRLSGGKDLFEEDF